MSRLRLALTACATGLTLVAATVPGLTSDIASGAVESPAAATAVRLSFVSAHELRGDLGPATGAPKAWAARTLAAQADRLGVVASDFRWELVRTTLIGTSVRGRQYVGGVPVEHTDVLVSSIGGRVAQIDADASPLAGAPAAHPVGPAAARIAALTRLDVQTLAVPTRTVRVLSSVGGRLVDTYQVSVVAKVPARAARVDIDAATGVVRDVADPAAYDRAPAKRTRTQVRARVFDPNPVVTSHDTQLRSPFETGTGVDVPLDSAALTAQLKTRTMLDLDADRLRAGILKGSWVDVVTPVGYVATGSGALHYSRSDPRLVGLMAYEHIDRYQRWLHSLGFTDVNAESQQVMPTLAEGYDNSMYMPGEDLIVYGGGGVPDAEDAEVILHEYGHAIQDAQVPGYGANEQGGAMGEGFGDFDSANYYALTSGGFNDLCVAEWDSTTYSTANPPCLRRMDSTKHYPKDADGEVHDDGEMWSAYLWRVRRHLGHSTHSRSVHAIKLVLTMHELLTPNATYGNAVAGLRTAARALHHTKWVRIINQQAKKTGYPLNP